MTSLSSQLQKLQQRSSDAQKHLLNSFLFEKADAKSFSREQIWQLASAGLETLVTIDNAFNPFVTQLFDAKKTRQERDQLTSEESRKLDLCIEHFLTLLSPHLFLTAAQQVFEYLVRVHEVHVYNVSAVLRAFLPYHNHNLFSRALLLLDLRDTGLDFLSKNQERGAPLPREHLIIAAGESREVLRLVCDMVTLPVRLGIANNAANALFAAVATRLSTHVEADSIWRTLLPCLLELMSGADITSSNASALNTNLDFNGISSINKEAACTGLLVLAAWSTEVHFSLKTVVAVIKPLISFLEQSQNSTFSIASLFDLLSIMDLLFRTQSDVVSQVAFHPQLGVLCSLPWVNWAPVLETHLSSAARSQARPLRALFSSLTLYCLERLKVANSFSSISVDVIHLLQVASASLPLTTDVVREFLKALMVSEEKLQDKKKENASCAKFFETVISSLERRYQSVFDSTLSALLVSDESAQASTFLSKHLSGTRYQMVSVKGSRHEAETKLPLFACLIHTTPAIRQLAASTLRAMDLKQLMSSTGKKQGGTAAAAAMDGSSLIELLAGVACYESVGSVARDFATTLSHILTLLTEAYGGGENKRALSKQLYHQFFRSVLYSLIQLVFVQNSADFTLMVYTDILQPLVERTSEKQSKSIQAKEETRELYVALLYYITVLYVSLVSEVENSGKGSSAEDKDVAGVYKCIAQIGNLLLQNFGDAVSVPSLFPQSSHNDNKTGTSSDRNKKIDNEDDDDDEVDESSGHNDKKSVSKSRGKSLSSKGKAAEGSSSDSFVDVFDSKSLLVCILPEAEHRISTTLRSMKAILSDQAASKEQFKHVQAETVVCVSSTLGEKPSEFTPILAKFLLGEKNVLTEVTSAEADVAVEGYLSLLYRKQRAEKQRLTAATPTAIGRGAKGTQEATLFLPSDLLTAQLGVVVSKSVRAALAKNDNKDGLSWLTSILRLHGYLNAAFPPLACNAEALPPALFEILVQSKGSYNGTIVPWFDLVFQSVFNAVGDATVGSKKATLVSLGLVLFIPLFAPQNERQKVLQSLQSIILESMSHSSSGKGSKRSTANTDASSEVSAAIVLQQFLSGGSGSSPLSITSLNSVVEAMAREESRFTVSSAAGELLAKIMIEPSPSPNTKSGTTEYAVPAVACCAVMEHFFPLSALSESSKKGASSNVARLNTSIVLPRVRDILKKDAVDDASAEFVRVVTSRSNILQSGGEVSSSPAEDATTQLCVLLLKRSHLRLLSSSATIPVFRQALTILARTLQGGELMHTIANSNSSIIFSTKGKSSGGASSSSPKKGQSGKENEEEFIAALAKYMAPVIIEAVRSIGPEVASFCMSTYGGYHRITLPSIFTSPDSIENHMDVVIDLLDQITPQASQSNASGWQAPDACALVNPLGYADAMNILQVALTEDVRGWVPSVASAQRLRLLSALLRASPTIRYDEDEDEESLCHLVLHTLSTYPIDRMSALFTLDERSEEVEAALEEANILRGTDASGVLPLEGSNRLLSTFARYVLSVVQSYVTIYLHSGPLLNEKVNQGALTVRGALLKQGLVLMATLLLQEEGGSKPVVNEDAEADEPNPQEELEADTMKEKIEVISELLRILAPLLANAKDTGATGGRHGSEQNGDLTEDVLRQKDFYLHIPIVALLVRLEQYELTATLHFKTAAEVCQSILNSFDIHTQIQCVSQLMRLVCDPAAQLTGDDGENNNSQQQHSAKKKQQQNSPKKGAEGGDANDDVELVKLFRRLVKPNQIINRQENVLNLINTTVKSDAFLGPFIELQHSTARSERSKKNKKKADEEAEVEEDEENMLAVVADGNRKDSVCMSLIVNALEFFSHYSDLNQRTEGEETMDGPDEQKSYTMLLELLAGNALACVLAGINEPTFVQCLLRLLQDTRASVQLKGLEVLVDRLHHSLPTVENTMTDEELEQHRRDLRDPRKKLTLMDLIQIKARPLTTKRSFALYNVLSTLFEFCLSTAVYNVQNSESALPQRSLTQLLYMSQLCLAAMEELVRIVASGGSTQAEKTLLNINRNKRVTEALLSKLFGNKTRVQEVYTSTLTLCEKQIPKLILATQRLLHNTSPVAGEGPLDKRVMEENLLSGLASCFTFLGTVTQVMGSSFVLQHCTTILHTIVHAAIYEVLDLPQLVSQGEAGSLLRHATLSCFIRCFPSCWHMSQPFLSKVLFSATHLININDTETHYLCQEVLTVLEALLEPQVFVDACTESFRGDEYVPLYSKKSRESKANASNEEDKKDGKGRLIRIKTTTHSFDTFFGCVGRRMQNLKKEELLHMSVLTEGTTPQNNFWLAVLQTISSTAVSSVASSEVVTPVLQAYTIFFLKFKPKHCTMLLRQIAEWTFGGDSESFGRQIKKQHMDSDEDEGDEHEGNTNSSSRYAVQRWILFFALYNHLLDKLEVILEFSFALATMYIVPVLANHCSSNKLPSKVNASLLALVLEGALDSVRRMALYHTPGPDADPSIPVDVYFASTEVFNSVMPALVHQLTNTAYLSDNTHDFTFRAERAVVPAVRAFFACLNASKLQSKTQAEIARGLRHPNARVRQVTVRCFDGIYADGGEELAARLMAEVLPAVVELTEDRDDAVVEETRKFCTNLSHMTGQDVLHAMS